MEPGISLQLLKGIRLDRGVRQIHFPGETFGEAVHASDDGIKREDSMWSRDRS